MLSEGRKLVASRGRKPMPGRPGRGSRLLKGYPVGNNVSDVDNARTVEGSLSRRNFLKRVTLMSAALLASDAGLGRAADTQASVSNLSIERDFAYAVRIHSEQLYAEELNRALDIAQAAGINTIDCEIIWATLDQADLGGQRRTYDWRYVDRLVYGAEERGLQVRFALTTTPDWVHPGLIREFSTKEDRKWHPPRGDAELQRFANFVTDTADRYMGRVRYYEIWNEPNNAYFWRPGPNPAEYASLLRTAYLRLKAVDPDIEVVFGGLALNNLGYLRQYYSAVKDSYADAQGDDYYFDVLDVHPYCVDRSPDRYDPSAIGTSDDEQHDFIGEVNGNFLGFRQMKSLMQNEGDLGKRLYLGEFGYRTTPGGVSDERRALFLKRAYALARNIDYVEGLSWYAYHPSVADLPEWTLLDDGLRPSLTFRALRQTTGAADSNVSLDVRVFRDEFGFSTIRSQLTNLSSSDVRRWELYVDGTLVKEQASLPIVWKPKTGQRAILAAYTREGSVWHSSTFTP